MKYWQILSAIVIIGIVSFTFGWLISPRNPVEIRVEEKLTNVCDSEKDEFIHDRCLALEFCRKQGKTLLHFDYETKPGIIGVIKDFECK